MPTAYDETGCRGDGQFLHPLLWVPLKLDHASIDPPVVESPPTYDHVAQTAYLPMEIFSSMNGPTSRMTQKKTKGYTTGSWNQQADEDENDTTTDYEDDW